MIYAIFNLPKKFLFLSLEDKNSTSRAKIVVSESTSYWTRSTKAWTYERHEFTFFDLCWNLNLKPHGSQLTSFTTKPLRSMTIYAAKNSN